MQRPSVCALVGLGWGDEGKGKIVDFLSREFDAVARFQGGANAGHTIVVGGRTFTLHLLPSGVLREGVINLIGPGVAVDPELLVEEIEDIERTVGSLVGRLFVDPRAHLVMPYHKAQDAWEEEKKGGLGTTKRGIGPCYRDRAQRVGVRVGDLYSPGLREALSRALEFNNQLLAARYGKPPFTEKWLLEFLAPLAERLRPYVAPVSEYLASGSVRLLLEGAQGYLLDLDWGTYPFVTSSNTLPGAASVGLGVPPQAIERVVGVMKAYVTRVGKGPFPTEMPEELAKKIRERGMEFGATTGRPRRCGWLDLVPLREAVFVSGVTELAITKADVLAGLDEVKVAVAYRLDERLLFRPPTTVWELWRVEPVYEGVPGWRDVRDRGFREFVSLLERELGVPVKIVSWGREREATVLL